MKASHQSFIHTKTFRYLIGFFMLLIFLFLLVWNKKIPVGSLKSIELGKVEFYNVDNILIKTEDNMDNAENVKIYSANGDLEKSNKNNIYKLKSINKNSKNKYWEARVDLGKSLDDNYYFQLHAKAVDNSVSVEIGTEDYHFGIFEGGSQYFFYADNGKVYKTKPLSKKINITKYNYFGVSQYKNKVKCYINQDFIDDLVLNKYDEANTPRLFIKGENGDKTAIEFNEIKIIGNWLACG